MLRRTYAAHRDLDHTAKIVPSTIDSPKTRAATLQTPISVCMYVTFQLSASYQLLNGENEIQFKFSLQMHLTSDDISNCAFAFDVHDVMD